MNKVFLSKMLKAERLKYEAFKEIMPEGIKKRADNFEKEAVNFIKDLAIEISKENLEDIKDKDCTQMETKKVTVDFSE